MEAVYTITQASNLTDLNAHTIRAWERRYKALAPERHVNGRRLYSESDVRRLHLLSTLVLKGHPISNVAGHTTDILQLLVETTAVHSRDSRDEPSTSSSELSDLKLTQQYPIAALRSPQQTATSISQFVLNNCLESLYSYNLVAIHAELESARQLLSASDFVLCLTIPLLQTVGLLVGKAKLSIAQEHALSAVLRSQLMQILFNARNSMAMRKMTRMDKRQGLNFALATPEGDLHEFGVLCAAIIIAVNGHFPHYFGANLPVDSIAEAANATKSDVVIIGVTHILKERRSMSDFDFACRLTQLLPKKTKIWWGGNTSLDQSYFDSHGSNQMRFQSLDELFNELQGKNL